MQGHFSRAATRTRFPGRAAGPGGCTVGGLAGPSPRPTSLYPLLDALAAEHGER